MRNGDARAAGIRASGIELVPLAAEVCLEPRVDVHWLELMEVAHHQSRGDAQGAAKGDGDVGQITANPFATLMNLNGRYGIGAAERSVAYGLAHPVGDCDHLCVAGLASAHDLGGHFTESVGLAVPTGQQVAEHVVRQLRHLHVCGVVRDNRPIRNLHQRCGVDFEFAFRGHQPLT